MDSASLQQIPVALAMMLLLFLVMGPKLGWQQQLGSRKNRVNGKHQVRTPGIK
jgi:hypothetical protein